MVFEGAVLLQFVVLVLPEQSALIADSPLATLCQANKFQLLKMLWAQIVLLIAGDRRECGVFLLSLLYDYRF